MLSPRRLGLLLSCGICILSQKPVLPADNMAASHSTVAQTVSEPLTQRGVSAADDSVFGTVFDTEEHLWKRWNLTHEANGNALVLLSTSSDGQKWTPSTQPSLQFGGDGSWDEQSISPIVVFNPTAADGQRYLLWYVGVGRAGATHDGLPEGNLGMAVSSDGRHFERLAASESPYQLSGLILRGRDAFPENPLVKSSSIGALQYSCNQGDHQIIFYKVGFDAAGNVAGAGIDRATSSDGSRWQVLADEPMSLQVVGAHEHSALLVGQLKRLAAACNSQPQL